MTSKLKCPDKRIKQVVKRLVKQKRIGYNCYVNKSKEDNMTEIIKEFLTIDGEPIRARQILIGIAGALGAYAAIWGLFILDLAIRG